MYSVYTVKLGGYRGVIAASTRRYPNLGKFSPQNFQLHPNSLQIPPPQSRQLPRRPLRLSVQNTKLFYFLFSCFFCFGVPPRLSPSGPNAPQGRLDGRDSDPAADSDAAPGPAAGQRARTQSMSGSHVGDAQSVTTFLFYGAPRCCCCSSCCSCRLCTKLFHHRLLGVVGLQHRRVRARRTGPARMHGHSGEI